MAAEINLRLTSKPESVMSARHALDQLAGVLPPEKLEDLRLVVSEVVTNSVRHARGFVLRPDLALGIGFSGISGGEGVQLWSWLRGTLQP